LSGEEIRKTTLILSKQANQIIRVKTADRREWLKSKQQWYAIDSQGNEIMESFSDLEQWDKPEFQYSME
jgi:hypothetical protein